MCHEFVRLRTNLVKPLYMKPLYVMDRGTGEKLYVSSYSTWFDTFDQLHGVDASGGLTSRR